jgi:hypothetical protein
VRSVARRSGGIFWIEQCGDMGNVRQGVVKALAVEFLAAGAPHQRTGVLRPQPLAAFPHGIFPGGPIPRVAPGLKIGLGPI